jgi:hypothetical protein
MNFLDWPRLKNSRAVFPSPISMMRLTSLKFTLASVREGTWKSGSFPASPWLRTLFAIWTIFSSVESFFLEVVFTARPPRRG